MSSVVWLDRTGELRRFRQIALWHDDDDDDDDGAKSIKYIARGFQLQWESGDWMKRRQLADPPPGRWLIECERGLEQGRWGQSYTVGWERAPARQRPDHRGAAIMTRSLGFLERWRAARYERVACAYMRCCFHRNTASPVTASAATTVDLACAYGPLCHCLGCCCCCWRGPRELPGKGYAVH